MAHPLHSVDLYPVLMKLIMIVLAETADDSVPVTSCQALETSAAIAQLLGFTVYPIASLNGHTDTVLNHISPQPPNTPGVLLSYPLSRDRYHALYAEALGKGIRLLNTPAEYRRVQEFDYSQLGSLTPKSMGKLRHSRLGADGFPLGRKFRVFIHHQQVLSYGYYWHGDDPYKLLSVPEEEAIFALALEASRRIQVPYVAIDVGQLEDESWVVMETGEPQFFKVPQVPLIQFWQELADQLRSLSAKHQT